MRSPACAFLRGKPLVSGTTGLSQAQLAALVPPHRRSRWSGPAISLGVAVLHDLVERCRTGLARLGLRHRREAHHTRKLDAPSGTA